MDQNKGLGKRLAQAKERAERLLADKSADIDYAKAQAELAESMAQLALIRQLHKKR